MDVQKLLEITISNNASDLHLVVGSPPVLRIDGVLSPVASQPVLSPEDTERLTFGLLSQEQKDLLLVNKEIDFSFALSTIARFRVNAYYQKGYLSAALRLIPLKIKTIEELSLPKTFHRFAGLQQGFILITGPTGHGKSTTLAAIISEINDTRPVHILTIEDPIEYVYSRGKGMISQRELHLDTHSWSVALRSALREDPDVVLIGEMRDLETITAAMTIAETGHLVFATLHTNSAAQSVDRIVDVFPQEQQEQIRLQLAATLASVVSQRLVPAIGGGRLPVVELLLTTAAVRTVIREGKSHMIDNIIQTSQDVGMATLEMSLAALVKSGRISTSVAESYAMRPQELARLIRR